MATNDGARRSAALVIAAQYSSILQILTGYVIFSDKHNVILLFRYIYIYALRPKRRTYTHKCQLCQTARPSFWITYFSRQNGGP